MELLGLCKWCGCPMGRDGPLVEFEGFGAHMKYRRKWMRR